MENVFVIANAVIPRYDLCKLDFAELEKIKPKIHAVADMLQDNKSKKILWTFLDELARRDIFHISWEKVYDGEEQYYPPDVIQLGQEESFVDCGAFNGDSLRDFLKKVNRQFSAFYAFEFEKENFKLLNDYVMSQENSVSEKKHTFNNDVWNESKISFIQSDQGWASSLLVSSNNGTQNEDEQVNLVALDDVLSDKKVSFIKMDVEGAELKALQGAKKIIRSQRPKLAISIYHKYEDFYEIPLYIKSLVDDYKIYFRCSCNLDQDIICYAI